VVPTDGVVEQMAPHTVRPTYIAVLLPSPYQMSDVCWQVSVWLRRDRAVCIVTVPRAVGCFSEGKARPGREADHSSQFNTVVMNN
jgi:hypothetical protein